VCPAIEFAEFTSSWPGLLSVLAGAVQLVPAGVVNAIRMLWVAPGARAGAITRTAVGCATAVLDHPTVLPAVLPGAPPFEAARGSLLSDAIGAVE
jgi:hypothetical protein